jgi:hypothetical protein
MGTVSMSMATLEESVDVLIMELLVLPPMFEFFQQYVLGRQTIRAKLELLRSYAKANRALIADADGALVSLQRTVELCELRNRLIHDVHEHDDDGHLIRRRVGREETTPVDLAEYRHLAWNLMLTVVPIIEDLVVALMPPASANPPAQPRGARTSRGGRAPN